MASRVKTKSERLRDGNKYLDDLEVNIMDTIRRNNPSEGSTLLALIDEREKMRVLLFEIDKNLI